MYSRPAHEPRLPRAERRAKGVYYTPPEVVQLIVERTLVRESGPFAPRMDKSTHHLQALRVLDPACGAGEFLACAQRVLSARWGAATANRSLYGVDIDPAAIAIARTRLPGLPPGNLLVADALSDSWQLSSFDAIIGNPPYVNIRQLAKALPAERIAELKKRYRTARGNFDLYVLFIERALELLKPGGRGGLIVPNKWATLDYARACRELLAEQATMEEVIDLSDSRVFAGASVYPHVLIFRKEPALGKAGEAAVLRGRTSEDAYPTIEVESRVKTLPLSSVAKLSCGTAGYSAQRIAQRLIELNPHPSPLSRGEGMLDFITSGNIDRYSIRPGQVRYLNRTYVRPMLPLDAPELTAAKRQLFRSPKIVIAGMSRRLEAAWDAEGLALGVQVFAASEMQVDPFYLLALLNSKLLSYLFATRFAAKRLSGGYLSINKGQLVKLPIVAGAGAPAERVGVPSIRRLSALAKSGQAGCLPYEEEADRLVYQLYGLNSEEIARVERHFSRGAVRAA